MKTIEVNLYKFSELSEDAKQNAIEKIRSSLLDQDYFWGNDAIKSIEKFMEHFNCSFERYSIDWFEKYRNEFHIEIPEYMNEISEDELKNYIETMGPYDSVTMKGFGNCMFTGYCADEDAADGARIAFLKGERNLYDILYAGYESWYEAVNSDVEYEISDKGIIETIEDNEYDFTEDGNLA